MICWEYRTESMTIADDENAIGRSRVVAWLEEFGREGWEAWSMSACVLGQVEHVLVYFKRPKP